ncbi:MAG: phage integrase SAM-like domain-containing protein [bacterium]
MGRVNVFLDTRRAKEGGKYPLKLSISFGGQFAYVGTGIDLDPKQWNGKDIVRCESKAAFTQLLTYRKSDIERALLGLETRGITSAKSPAHLKDLLERQMSGRFQASTYLVSDAFRQKISQLTKNSTKTIYGRTLDSIGRFADLRTLTMADIDYRWLCGFESFLRSRGNMVNSISIDLRNIRAVFNHLIDLGDIELDSYPFRKFKIRSEATRKRALTITQLRQIRDQKDGPMKRYADLFMLIFYLRGINIIDLCNLRGMTPDGRIEYRRSKTGKIYSVKLEPEALEIIEKYRGTAHLIDILDRRKEKAAHRSFTSRMNKYLKTMIPGISSYWARHTWATIAADLDIPNETIAASLGHSFGNKTTSIYIQPNERKVDEANRRVIDYVMQK